MSYSSGGKTLPSNRTYHESLPVDDTSGAASLSSQLNLYNSELASSSQHCLENTLYHDGVRYSLHHNLNDKDQQQQLHYKLNHINSPLTTQTLPRSSPIAIVRKPEDRKKESDESDIDDDDSDIDVERDAIKLQRKYGNKIIQTYIQDSTIMQSSNDAIPRDKSSVLNAPYLGSLSKSSNQVLSLPPMSLAGDAAYLGEPPESIVSYGSLRDSHERGRFLDGPSSYREPMSGKIRQLDHRLRYHGRQPELNIGERLQQSRKLKELRLREESKKKKEGLNIAEDCNDGSRKEKKEAKSSLSAMMNEASKSLNTSTRSSEVGNAQEGHSFLDTERMVPIERKNPISTKNCNERYFSKNLSPRNMLSTSLTAFELLKTSNTDILRGGNTTEQSIPMARTDTNQTIDFKASPGFQPLARSMSDPSPRFQNLSLSEIPSNPVSPSIQTPGFAAQMDNAIAGARQRGIYVQLQHRTQNMPHGEGIMFNGSGERSAHFDHDPNTDGAFGDMDM